jgi:hypothetical protein
MTNPDMTLPMGDDFLDLIVDGKLAPSELRAALERLENEPDGWKRCTLAFLEAQCWRQTFLQLGERATRGALPPNALRSARSHGRQIRSPWNSRAVAAAVFCAAFGLGWIAHRTGPAQGTERRAALSAQITAAEAQAKPTLPTAADVPLSSEPPPAAPTPPVRLVERVRLDEAEVPVLAAPRIVAEWLKNQPPPLSEYRKAVLQQHGYRVDERRDVIPATLADGRPVAVPVDLVQIRYTGNEPL